MEGGFGVTVHDILQSGWKAALSSVEAHDHMSMSLAFRTASSQATTDGKGVAAKALALLAAATSMALHGTSTNAPFIPRFESNEGRTALPEDFTLADLEALRDACPEIDDPWLKARLADIVWLSPQTRHIDVARIACDAYLDVPLEPNTWHFGALDCWRRAISLCLQLGRNERPRLDRIEHAILSKARAAAPDSDFYLLKLATLLSDGFLGKANAAELAGMLLMFANAAKARRELRMARHYFESAAEWFSKASSHAQRIDCLCDAAETFVGEAEMRIASDAQGDLVASGFYESAIQAFRRIPRLEREQRGLDKRISDIHAALRASSIRSMDQMHTISGDKVDLSESAEAAKAFVRKKNVGDAVHALSRIHADQGYEAHLQNAKEFFGKNFLHGLGAMEYRGTNGRVVARRPGFALGEANDAPSNQIALQAEAARSFCFQIPLVVQGQILPALQQVLLDHRILLNDLIALSLHSPIVPPGRAQLVGKALFFGFEHDFETALHLVVSQIEHIVRWQLNSNGVKTTTLSKDGIETENGLSTLTDSPEFATIFGKDIAFEIRTVFCDAFGLNFRNEVAHGLLSDGDGNAVESAYAWWLLLKLVFSHFVAAQLRQKEDGQKADPAPPISS